MIDLSHVRFGKGKHAPIPNPTGNRDMCIMEAVALFAGEPWSDGPECASPMISAFLRKWNDALSDDDRDRLLPASLWVPRLVGSCGDTATEWRRSYLALDWLIRTYAPVYLDLVPSFRDHAEQIRNLPEVTRVALARQVKATVDAARDDALAAAFSATGNDTWTDTWTEARSEAWVTSGAAGGAARDAAISWGIWNAWVAAGDAAWTAARAAWVAAGAPSQPVEFLERSALDLLDRMIEVKP